MNNLITKTWKPLLSLLFGVAVMLFWAVPYMAGLCFQEQYQMFLFDTNYFLERIVLPGGLADYLSRLKILMKSSIPPRNPSHTVVMSISIR